MIYRREIDGLRAVAVLPVILFHAGLPFFSGGFVGVDVFFVISGYLITTLIVKDIESGQFSILHFYERRVRRILPALFFVALVCTPIAAFLMLPGQFIEYSQSLIALVTFSSNIFFWLKTGYFAEAAELKPMLHTWSLAVEEQYYLLFPPVLMLAWRFWQRGSFWLIVVGALVSFVLCEWGWRTSPVANFFLLATRAWELLAGAICAYLLQYHGQRSSNVLSLVGLGMILIAVLAFDENTPFPSFYAVLPVLGTALIIVYATASTFVGVVLGSSGPVAIGLISYSAYLWHQPLFAFARLAAEGGPVSFLFLISLAALSLLLAALTWRFVEQPFRRKSSLSFVGSRRGLFLTSGAVALLITAVGMVGYSSHGLLFRYPPPDRALASFKQNEAGGYVRERFGNLVLRDFPENQDPNVLLIGDSFAQDLVNILYEGGMDENINLSTYHVSRQCGNLLLDYDLLRYVAQRHARLCRNEQGYRNAELLARIEEANVILLASDWQDWQISFLASSLDNMRMRTSAKIILLGRKDFGDVNLNALLRIPAEERVGLRNEVPRERLSLNERAKAAAGASFLDLHEMLCGASSSCPLFTSDGSLISYDGTHLTRAGAQWSALRLKNVLRFSSK